MGLMPTNEPGVFAIPEIQKLVKLTEWEEKDIYDTIAIDAATQLAGNTFELFTDVENKRDIDSNLSTGGKMPARSDLIVLKPSLYVQPMWGTAVCDLSDAVAIYHEGLYELEKNSKPQVSKTHLLRLQSGYGVVAYGLTVGATAVAPTSLGVASPAAIPPLLIPFTLQPEDDFKGEIAFQQSRAGAENNAGLAPTFTSYTLAQDVAIKAFLHGFVKGPATK